MNTPLSYSVTRWKDGGWQHIDDAVSPEEPVYVSWSGSSCRLWAWPDDLEPLAIGHVLLDRRHLGPEAGPSPFRMSGSVRAVSVPPGIDAKHAFAVELKRMEKKGHDETPSIVMTPDAIVKHMDAFLTLEGSCPLLWESTGCFHRAGMFDPNTGTFLRLAEDIGRHNALDKVIGYALRHQIDLKECMVYSSGRIPTDMAMKAIYAGIPVLSSKASPTTEAIELAKTYRLTLICAARRDRMKVFSQV